MKANKIYLYRVRENAKKVIRKIEYGNYKNTIYGSKNFESIGAFIERKQINAHLAKISEEIFLSTYPDSFPDTQESAFSYKSVNPPSDS